MIGSLNPLPPVIEALQNQQAIGQAQIQAHNEALFAEFMDAVDTSEARSRRQANGQHRPSHSRLPLPKGLLSDRGRVPLRAPSYRRSRADYST